MLEKLRRLVDAIPDELLKGKKDVLVKMCEYVENDTDKSLLPIIRNK